MALNEYQLGKEIGGGPLYIIYQARFIQNGRRTLIKMPRTRDHESISLPRLHREFEIGKHLSYDGLIPVTGLINTETDIALVLSDPGGLPLDSALSEGPLDVEAALALAIKLARLLSRLHNNGYTHLNLTPLNIWIDESSDNVWLTGLGSASRAPRGVDAELLPKIIEDVLGYTSPEQTGRTSRMVDYRTDFYAFGVILYEMLTGERPFESDDPLELVHAHVAREPLLPSQMCDVIPGTVVRIIKKLLSKSAEMRYQSATGLEDDLVRCLEEIKSNGSVSRFDLGTTDHSARFELPQKLYGRRKETRLLSTLFERALDGKPQFIRIYGPEGSGKTALVDGLRQEILTHNGYFVSSKWDEVEHLQAYSPALQIFKSIVHQLLAESETDLSPFRTRLKEALGKNINVIAGLFPEAFVLFGDSGSIPKLEPKEARFRLHQSLQTFLRILAENRALVVFYDDLHWVDKTGIDFIRGVFGPNMGRVLLVCGYRDNEIEQPQALKELFDAVCQKGFTETEHSLPPLDADSVGRLVAETFRTSRQKASHLADTVFRTTSGNPYFIKAFLTSLWEENKGHGEPFVLQDQGLEMLGNVEKDGGLVNLTQRRLTRLSQKTRRIVSMAAALGTYINTDTIACICEMSPDQVENHLVKACENRILLRQSSGYRFEHDQIRQKAYDLIPKQSRQKTHLKIARLLKQRSGEKQLQDFSFAIADQYIRGMDAIHGSEKRMEAAVHFLVAGNKSRTDSAFPLAYTYFTNGIRIMGKHPWTTSYETALGLYSGAAETAFLLADLKTAQELINIIHSRSKHILDQISAYEIQMSIAYASRSESDILKMILEVLESLGVSIPEDTSPARTRLMIQEVRDAMIAAAASPKMELRQMEDPSMLAAMRLIRKAIPAFGWVDSSLIVLLTGIMAKITLKYGYSPESDLAFILAGNLMCALFNDFESGYKMARAGLSSSERRGSTPLRAMSLLVFHMTVGPWREHPDMSLEGLERTHAIARKLGDSITAGYAAYAYCGIGFFSGIPLPSLERRVRKYYREALHDGLERIQGAFLNLHHTISILMGTPDRTREIAGVGDIQEKIYEKWTQSPDPTVQQIAGTNEMMVHYIFRRHDKAFSTAIKINEMPMGSGKGLLPSDAWACLCLMTGYDPKAEHPGKGLENIKKATRYLELRATAAPENYTHRLNLVKAEQLRIQGKFMQAVAFYEQAIEGAGRHGFLNDEAIANELAAEFYLDAGAGSVAAMYLGKAISVYDAWGADAKTDQLSKTYRKLLAKTSEFPDQTRPGLIQHKVGAKDNSGLDSASIQRASQALASELDQKKLITRLMEILLQNAAAQRGFLLRENEQGICILAAVSVDEPGVRFPLQVPLESSGELSAAIVRYVRRTRVPMVTGNAFSDPRFANDTYIQNNHPKSILCIPMMNQGRVVALLYMENNRIEDAFTEKRLTAVNLISSQTAAALENAQLHENLKQEVFVRRKAEKELRKALEEVAELKDKLQAENLYLRDEIKTTHDFEEIVGDSDALKGTLYKIGMVAATHANVLILGETGTGKELVARAVHAKSQRKNASLIKVNCAALPASLIESELFGHEKGAFTGAIEKKIGRFELADKGTIFLDEIGDLPLELQAKLLRVLQENEFERLGSAKTIKVDVRVIAATNRNLEKESEKGTFRSDLYYRLSVFPISLPPLRDRKGDIPLLSAHFLKKKQVQLGKSIEHIPQRTIKTLNAYHWPGNVRELENIIERAAILSPGKSLELEDAFGAVLPQSPSGKAGHNNMQHIERQHILNIIESCGWKIKGKGNAAEQLGLHPNTLHSRMKKLGIKRPVK